MDDTGLVAKKFIKFLSRKDISSNEMSLPSDFIMNYSNHLPSEIHLRVRTGYDLVTNVDKNNGLLNGMAAFYTDFGFKGGEVLVFEYYGNFAMTVYIIGNNCCEIEYPLMLNYQQKGTPTKPRVSKGGWKFVHFLNSVDVLVEGIAIPGEFVEACGGKIAKFLHFILSNGQRLDGRYSPDSKKISGLSGLRKYFNLDDLNTFQMLLFTYDGHFRFHISAFDQNLVEIIFPGTPTSGGKFSDSENVAAGFDITVQPFHMLQYCHGVDIPATFRSNWYMWGKADYITVYYGERSWRLEVKHRADWKRATIHRGWLQLREDLQLAVGDKCIFQCSNESFKHFSLRVEKTGE